MFTTLRHFALPIALLASATSGWWSWGVPDLPDGTSSAPVAVFVSPADGAVVTESLSYGAVRVRAWDPDSSTDNGDGIDAVHMAVTDESSGRTVAWRTEFWPTYDFGPNLPDGTYTFTATAFSDFWSDDGAATTSITITLATEASPPAPTTTVPPTTVPPTIVPPTIVPPTTVPPTTAPPSVDEVAQAAAASLAELNGVRADAGLGHVVMNAEMTSFALDWSREMSRSGFRHSGGPYAENIAWYSDDGLSPQAAAEYFNVAWVNSPGHYANMTTAEWTEVGIGLYRDSSGWWATHVFQ